MNLAPVALTAMIGVLLLASVPLGSQEAPHGLLGTGPQGASQLRQDLPGLRVTHGQLDPHTDSLIIAGPTLAYTDREAQTIRAFVAEGGRLLIADSTGTGRSLLARLDVELAITGLSVTTPVHDGDTRSPIVFNTGTLAAPASFPLRTPAVVTGNGTPLLQSSELAWLDQNGDARPDITEPQGTFAFAMLRQYGQGDVLVVGVPTVFDNAGHPLRAGLLAWLAEGDRTVTYDDGHRQATDPVGMAGLLSGATPLGWLIPVATLAVLIRTFQVRPVRVRPKRIRRSVHADIPTFEELDP